MLASSQEASDHLLGTSYRKNIVKSYEYHIYIQGESNKSVLNGIMADFGKFLVLNVKIHSVGLISYKVQKSAKIFA